MEIGKTYQFINDSNLGDYSSKKLVITKLTKRTVHFKYLGVTINDEDHSWLYASEFKKYVQEITPWSGSKLIHNFI